MLERNRDPACKQALVSSQKWSSWDKKANIIVCLQCITKHSHYGYNTNLSSPIYSIKYVEYCFKLYQPFTYYTNFINVMFNYMLYYIWNMLRKPVKREKSMWPLSQLYTRLSSSSLYAVMVILFLFFSFKVSQ